MSSISGGAQTRQHLNHSEWLKASAASQASLLLRVVRVLGENTDRVASGVDDDHAGGLHQPVVHGIFGDAFGNFLGEL